MIEEKLRKQRKIPTDEDNKFKPYSMRKLNAAAHTILKSMAPEYDLTLEEMVNYALRIGIWTLTKKDVEEEVE
jgi:hypothetical protein